MDCALRVTNAKLRGKDGLWSILAEGGVIQKIAPMPPWESARTPGVDRLETIDAGGNLVIPPFIDAHVHLDAVLSCTNLKRQNVSGTLLEAIEIWSEWKTTLTKKIIKENAVEALHWYAANGVLKIRTHADCSDPRLLTVESLLEVKDEVKDVIDIQVTAFPQDGIFTKPDGEKLLRRALEMGADVVGGSPHLEYTREDGVRAVETVYNLAYEFDRFIDIHVDETGDPQSRFVEVMAKENIVRGMHGRAAASHTTAMHNYNNDYAFKLCSLLKKAEMNMIVNPFDNSVLQNRLDGYPRGRGITRVDELLAHAINVCIGHDSIMDPWYSMGKADMLHAANLLSHIGHLNGHSQMTVLLDMVTAAGAKTLCVEERYGVDEGKPADMVVLDCESEAQAIRLESEKLFVIKGGRIIARTSPAQRTVNFGNIPRNIDFKRGCL